MRTEKYRHLTDVHLLQRIWRNELELALQEVDFWEELLGTPGEGLDNKTTGSDTWKGELSKLHHFRQWVKRLLDEIMDIDRQVADGVRLNHVLDTDTRLNHQYLRQEMDSFHVDFRAFKSDIRQYLVVQPTF